MRIFELLNEFLKMIHQLSERFGILVDWIGEAFMQVGLAIVIFRGYLRHLWVSEIFQCHFLN